jgi:hypothetical protein
METQTTEQFLRDKLVQTETELQKSTLLLESLRQTRDLHIQIIENIKEWAMEKLDEGVDSDLLNELSFIAGFELSKEYQVTVQVEYAFNVKANNDDEVQEVIDNLDIPRLSDEKIDDYVWGEIVDSSYDEV